MPCGFGHGEKKKKKEKRWELVPATLCDGPHLHVSENTLRRQQELCHRCKAHSLLSFLSMVAILVAFVMTSDVAKQSMEQE